MNAADYSITELCTALAAALRVLDALDGTDLDLVTRWQEEAEARAETIAMELGSRRGEGDEEERERMLALSAYDARLMELPEEMAA